MGKREGLGSEPTQPMGVGMTQLLRGPRRGLAGHVATMHGHTQDPGEGALSRILGSVPISRLPAP